MTEIIIGASYRLHGPVAVITLDNPPVNGLGHEVRSELVAGVDRALADPAVNAVILMGAGKMTLSGLVTHEFPLDRVNDAIRLVRSGEAGRVLVSME